MNYHFQSPFFSKYSSYRYSSTHLSKLDTIKASEIDDLLPNKVLKSIVYDDPSKIPSNSGLIFLTALVCCMNSLYTFGTSPSSVRNFYDSDLCVLIKQINKVKKRPIKVCTAVNSLNEKIRAKTLNKASKDIFKASTIY